MDGQIITRTIVLDLARRATDSGQPLPPQAYPWPIGTAAGQQFQAEVIAQQALRAASRRVEGGGHG